MIYFAITDSGVDTNPIIASSFSDAVSQIKARYGSGDGPINVALFVPLATGQVVPGNPPTINQTGDAATQNTIFQAASNALSSNATYLGITSPTNSQVVAQVKALTQQVDGIIRLLVGNFTGTT